MTQPWQEELQGALRSAGSLQDYAFFRDQNVAAVEERFRTLVPAYYLNLIDPADPADPIARMAFPSSEEAAQAVAGLRDPIGDLAHRVAPRLTHRYRDRALLHVTNLCPMYCRFCFRKNLMNEKDEGLYGGDFEPALAYLSAHPEIQEVILTGGDPWMLSDERLSALVDALDRRVPHLQRLRFHTRMPVTLPSRVNQTLLGAILRPGRFFTVVVTHFNHPREITDLAREAAGRLKGSGVLLLNQTVLLKGVNDCADILRELFMELGQAGVLPYYLHHCDLVEGAEHFRLGLSDGKKLWKALRGTMPGYFIPEYVLDTPGGGGKVPIGADFVRELSTREHQLERGSYLDPVTLN